ncbi:MAG: hypothetical protein ACK5Z2_14750 [Bacteroidota bacterium]
MSTCRDCFYEQGNEGFLVMFQLVCINTPVGTIVSLTSSNPEGCTPPIYIPPTKVLNSTGFIVGMESEVQANYTSTLTYCFELPQGVPPPAGFSITVQAMIPVSSGKISGSTSGVNEYHLKELASAGN